IQGARSLEIALIACEITQVGKTTGYTPLIAKLSEESQSFLVQTACGSCIALFASDIALIIERPCHSIAVAEFPENAKALFKKRAGQPVVSLRLDHICQIA